MISLAFFTDAGEIGGGHILLSTAGMKPPRFRLVTIHSDLPKAQENPRHGPDRGKGRDAELFSPAVTIRNDAPRSKFSQSTGPDGKSALSFT